MSEKATPAELESLSRWADMMGTGEQIFPHARTVLKVLAEYRRMEAVMARSQCAYCGQVFQEAGEGAADQIIEHIKACVSHPMAEILRENERLRAALAACGTAVVNN